MARKSTVKKEEFKRCTNPECSKKDRKISDFYNSKNSIFVDGKVPICKECIKKMVDVEDIKTVYNFLKSVNLVFDVSIWNSCLESNRKDKIGEYMRRINSMIQYKGLTWDDSIFELNESNDEVSNNVEQEVIYEENKDKKPFVVTKEMIYMWGKGYTPEQYEYVEYCYSQWKQKKGNGKPDLAQDKLFKMLAQKELDIRIAREKDESTKDLEATYIKLMDTADLSLKNKKDRFADNNDLVKWGRDVERYHPADYFKNKPLFDDYDNIEEYITRFMKRPLLNTIAGTREFDHEYTIENLELMDDECEPTPKKKRKSRKKVDSK